MACQMMRVISSPSSSTTGFFTLILAMKVSGQAGKGRKRDGQVERGYSARRIGRKADFCARLSRLFRTGGTFAAPAASLYRATESAMPGAGTDKTKRWVAAPAPIVILVEPQLGANIGAVARGMANFGLLELRLVKP